MHHFGQLVCHFLPFQQDIRPQSTYFYLHSYIYIYSKTEELPYIRHPNIELPMAEYRPSEIQPNMLNCLALRLVKSHCKSKSDRKLSSSKLEGNLIFSGLVHQQKSTFLIPSY